MLQRIAPSLFQGTTGETVTIAAVAQRNNGVEAATFRYGATPLTPRQVQGHPGGEFNVRTGTETFGALVVFDPSSPNAHYELFEEDDNGILQPLQVFARPLTGPIVQFQIMAIPVPAVVKKTARRSAKKTGERTVKKVAKKVAKRTAVKRGAKRTTKKAAKKAVKAAKKTVRKSTRKVAKRRPR
jgi:hypothetical protein